MRFARVGHHFKFSVKTTYSQEGMAMRYNTWNLGGSAGGKQMEMVDAVPGVPKVGLSWKTIFNSF